MTFAVITKVPDPETGGNLANGPSLFVQVEEAGESNGWLGKYASAYEHASGPMQALVLAGLAYPVFTLGEILVLNESGREVAGEGRKPSKWMVEYEEFDEIADAVKCAQRVQQAVTA